MPKTITRANGFSLFFLSSLTGGVSSPPVKNTEDEQKNLPWGRAVNNKKQRYDIGKRYWREIINALVKLLALLAKQ